MRRYEHPRPGDLIHVDVATFGNIPDGGGWRFVGRRQGADTGPQRLTSREPPTTTQRWATVLSTRSSMAAPRWPARKIHDDEKTATAAGVFQRATVWFADRGVTVSRVLSDNGSTYRSHLWRDTCRRLGMVPKRTRPYRPQANSKIERFHRTLADGWVYARRYLSGRERRDALGRWWHDSNHHRPHSACGG